VPLTSSRHLGGVPKADAGGAASSTDVEDILDEFTFWVNQGRRAMASHWCQQDLSLSYVHALALLQAEGPLTMSRLAERMGVSLPNATGIIGRMEERGLVERQHDEQDRRVVHALLTEKGLEAMEEADQARRQRLGRIIDALTPAQRRRCLQSLRELRGAAERVAASPD
jgi:DNA-binding MarR family transcriptional regulator